MENQDYKYVMDDLYRINIGARYTYEEILDNVEVSYKFRNICRQYFEREVAPDTTIESHLYYLRPSDESFRVYQKLKTKVTVLRYHPGKQQKDGSPLYQQVVMKVDELAAMTPQQKQAAGILIREIELSKLGLMTFVL